MIRALVADDEPVAREGLLRLLREDADLEVVGEASDGDEALTLLRRVRPDLVFLDIRMPGLDGLDVADALGGHRRAHGHRVLHEPRGLDNHVTRRGVSPP